MKREIKFRGQGLEYVEWIFGGIAHDREAIINEDYLAIPVDRNTVGEFTGFKDIDGKEIYEGDIIQNEVNPFEIYQVAMVNGCWSAENKVDCGVLHWFLENAAFRVIGNIHDNPELLEGGKADD